MIQLVGGRTNSASPRLSCLSYAVVVGKADAAHPVILCTGDLITNLPNVKIYYKVERVATAVVVVAATADNIQLGICQFAYIAHNSTPYLD
jgi:hypothetical protein